MKKTPLLRRWNPFLQTAFIPLILVNFVLCITMHAADDSLADTLFNDPSPATMRQAVQKWQAQFGPVDFGENEMFYCMAYLHPQPKSAFKPLGDLKVAKRIQLDWGTWVGEFFKGRFADAVMEWRPSSYYLNQGRPEASLLLYEGIFDRYALTIAENYNVVFLTIVPTNGTPATGFTSREIATLMTNWLNVKYESADEAIREFSLPNVLTLGQVFTNKKYPQVGRIRSWQDYIVGFQSSEGLCLMIFKAQAKRASGSFPYDYNWLNKWLYKSDGYTLLDPPRNEKVNNPAGVGRPPKRQTIEPR